MSENSKLIIDLCGLSAGSRNTIKRELKVLIEDYAWKKMINSAIKVTEEE